jgi:hypothetical protein
MTLLNRILQQSVIAKGNYLQIPYLLQIDFFGYNDDGIPMKIEDITKYIPIKIASMGMKVTHKGAEYNIAAYPFNHQAFAESVATNPIKLSVTASTVSDFFESMIAPDNFMGPLPDSAESKAVTDVTNTNAAVRAEQEQNNSAIRENTDQIAHLAELNAFGEDNGALRHSLALQNANLTERNLVLSKLPKTDVVVKSYTEAINAWLRQPTKDKKADHYDQIKFVIDKSIAEATFPDKDTRNLLSSAYSLLQDEETGTKTNTDKLQSVISINQGMSILDVIELAIKNSSYVYKQILNIYKPGRKEVSKKELEDLMLPLKWFKVIPQIELGEYDVKRGDFAKTITYHIKESILYNTKSEDAPQGKPKHYVKDYQYIFTGKNYDILNFDLTFDTLYFTVIPANPSIKDPTSQSPAKQPTESSSVDEVYSMDQVKAIINARLAGSASLHPKKVFTAPLPGSSANDDSVAESLKRLSKNILSSSAGDMIRVDLKILGDPDFIKQDDIFYNSFFFQKNDIRINNNGGSLWMDTGNLTIQLNINSPVDYDDTFGVAIPNRDPYGGIFTYNAFSGIYKIITIENVFSRGKFEQVLDIVRSPIQSLAQLKKADDQLQSNRDQLEKALSLARNVNNNRPSNLLNVPIRSTAGALGRTAGILYGQQSVVNNASSAVASLNGLIGGLQAAAAIPAMLTQIGVSVATRAVSNVIGKGIDSAAKAIQGAFNVPDQALLGSFEAAELGSSLSGPDLALLGSFEAAELDSSLNFISEINLAGF